MTQPDYERLVQLEQEALQDHAIVFDSVFKDIGGRANISAFDTPDGRLTAYHEGSFRNFGVQLSALLRARGSDQTIYCDVIASPGLNAVATRADAHRLLIGVNVGTYLRLRRALSMLLHNVSIPASECSMGIVQHPFTDVATIGPIGKYQADDLLAVLDEDAPVHEQWARLLEFISHPIAEESRVTDAVMSMAVDFVLLHECVHVVNGHVSELQQRGLRRLWHRETNERYDADALSRGCEVDADAGAGTIIGRALLDNGTGVSTYDFDRRELFYLLAFSLGCTINLFDISAPSPAAYAASEHPHHELRYLLVVKAIGNALAERDESASHEWKAIESDAFADVRAAFERSRLGGRAFHYLQPVLPSTQVEALTTAAPQLAWESEVLLDEGRAAQHKCRHRFGLPVLFLG